MPKGPQGQKRPADVIGAAIRVARIATGEEEEDREEKSSAAQESGRKGGKARAEKMPAKRRSQIARRAARHRWGKDSPEQESAE